MPQGSIRIYSGPKILSLVNLFFLKYVKDVKIRIKKCCSKHDTEKSHKRNIHLDSDQTRRFLKYVPYLCGITQIQCSDSENFDFWPFYGRKTIQKIRYGCNYVLSFLSHFRHKMFRAKFSKSVISNLRNIKQGI